ncbi:MAG: flagellar hook protein FlgE [Burkholderiales bacterium]|nr:flagellar hook protein FlgE [Burkholderiales bacterium]
MSFQQGLSGLNAAAQNLDVIGNNVANANTVGYKGSTSLFADVYANALPGGGGVNIGIGTTLAAVAQDFGQGNISTTNNPMDIAINGSGFYRMSDGGSISYSRNGQFQLDKDGYIVNVNGQRLTGYAADATGSISTATLGELQLGTGDLAPQASTAAQAVVNLDSRSANLVPALFDPTDTRTFTSATSMSTFDSLGNDHVLSMYFVKTAPNAWSVFGTQDGVQIGAAALGTLNFLPNGSLDLASTTLPFNVSAPVSTGAASPLAYTLDLTGSTQFGSSFGVNRISQDGFASGRLSGYSTDASGVIEGLYTNGQSRAQGQIALANFLNPNGLHPMGGNGWVETPASGAPLVGTPGSGSLGVLQSSATEESNIDLTAELVNMITAQRVYQANAQTIKTQDSVLQTLVNMR